MKTQHEKPNNIWNMLYQRRWLIKKRATIKCENETEISFVFCPLFLSTKQQRATSQWNKYKRQRVFFFSLSFSFSLCVSLPSQRFYLIWFHFIWLEKKNEFINKKKGFSDSFETDCLSVYEYVTHARCDYTYRPENSIVNQITTTISILSSISIAWSSYSSIVQKTLKAKHVNTIKNLCVCAHMANESAAGVNDFEFVYEIEFIHRIIHVTTRSRTERRK